MKLVWFSLFDIRTETEYPILTFKILFWYYHWVRKSYFHIQNLIFTYALSRIITILTFKIQFWHSHWGGTLILTFKTLFWDSHLVRLSCFDIQISFLTLALSRKILFWHSRFYFDIRSESEYPNLTIKIVFWHSTVGGGVIPCDFLAKIDFILIYLFFFFLFFIYLFFFFFFFLHCVWKWWGPNFLSCGSWFWELIQRQPVT